MSARHIACDRRQRVNHPAGLPAHDSELFEEGTMRFRIFVTTAALVGLAGAGTLVARAATNNVCCVEHHACCDDSTSSCCREETVTRDTQWSLVNFLDPVLVKDRVIMGPVLIVHDSAKMARGEACTTFYRFEPGKGPKEALVSFHCRPVQRELVEQTTLSVVDTGTGCKRLTEYQIGGDSEAHGIPSK
jgi:hypothetical protein